VRSAEDFGWIGKMVGCYASDRGSKRDVGSIKRACLDAVHCLEILAMSDQDLDQNVPSIRLRQPGVVVYLCGIATSVLTIFAVKWGNAHDFYPMGWSTSAWTATASTGM
jgi:hypothetical protein